MFPRHLISSKLILTLWNLTISPHQLQSLPACSVSPNFSADSTKACATHVSDTTPFSTFSDIQKGNRNPTWTDDLGRPGLNAHHIADEVLATQHQNSNSPAGPTVRVAACFQSLEVSLQWNPIKSHFKLQTCLTGFHMCLWHSPLPTADPGKKHLTWYIYVYLDSMPFIICTSQQFTTY